jgi:hypothetical protein
MLCYSYFPTTAPRHNNAWGFWTKTGSPKREHIRLRMDPDPARVSLHTPARVRMPCRGSCLGMRSPRAVNGSRFLRVNHYSELSYSILYFDANSCLQYVLLTPSQGSKDEQEENCSVRHLKLFMHPIEFLDTCIKY